MVPIKKPEMGLLIQCKKQKNIEAPFPAPFPSPIVEKISMDISMKAPPGRGDSWPCGG